MSNGGLPDPVQEPEGVGIGWRALIALLARLPQASLSRATGRLADIPVPRPLRSPLYGAFAALAGIDLSEAGDRPREYRTFDAFFTRRLAQGARSWPSDPNTVASPVDGRVGQVGTIRNGTLLQAKGRPYSAARLLDDEQAAARFDGGQFATLYLSPRDYHRIHAPAGGSVSRVRHVPGALLPVNQPAIRHVAGLFPRNERVVCYLDSTVGRIAVVAVGAFNVGRIEVVFDGGWRTNRRGAVAREIRYESPALIERGDELMIFHLGSTVVLLFEPQQVRLASAIRDGARVKLGQAIASAAG